MGSRSKATSLAAPRYVVEPSGHSLQLNGFFRHAPDSLAPKWNESLCGQGNCSADGGFGIGGPPYEMFF